MTFKDSGAARAQRPIPAPPGLGVLGPVFQRREWSTAPPVSLFIPGPSFRPCRRTAYSIEEDGRCDSLWALGAMTRGPCFAVPAAAEGKGGCIADWA